MRVLLERFDVLAAPVTQVAPFSIDTPWPREIAGVAQEKYTDWFRSCSRITVTAHPAVSVPAGFTASGLPVGLQLVGRYRDELGLLKVAAAFEAATGFGARRPSL
jgi:amidase